MLAEFGFGTLVLAFALALYACGAATGGSLRKSPEWIESARRAVQLTFPILTLAVGILISLLISGHYEVAYVFSVDSSSMPLYLKITALWGGQAGSLLFWSWLMSGFAAAITLRRWDRDRELLPWVAVVISVTLAFFLSLTIFFNDQNPFARWWQTTGGAEIASMFPPAGATLINPGNGQGLNELLRHPGMILHPPMLYLGFVGLVVPFSFAIAALITGRTDDRWIRITRRWTLMAWLFLSCGLVLGMRWAYDVLGWGGYWSWDPVEIAALMPWLTGTAFLHSVMIQEKRGLLKQWNMLLILLTYLLVIFGTFLTRSGVLSSVHAFAVSDFGPMFFVFMGLTFIVSVALLLYRWKDLSADMVLDSLLSRESLFLLNNLLFVCVLVVCLVGVLFPLLSELVTGQKLTVGPPFYLQAAGPLFAALLALMGIAPLSAWGRSTLQTLGRAVWIPAIPTLLTPLALFLLGVRSWVALLGFSLVAFVLFISLLEYGRGVRSRMKGLGEGMIVALLRLVAHNHRRYGGYLVHIAMVVMAIGILGIEVFQTSTQKTLAVGDSLGIAGYTVRFDSLAQFTYTDGRLVTRAVVSVYRGGKLLQVLYPRVDLYPDGQPVTIPGLRSTLADDLYVVLSDWQDATAYQAPFTVYHNPLVDWLWIGSLLFVAGCLVAAWPEREDGRLEAP